MAYSLEIDSNQASNYDGGCDDTYWRGSTFTTSSGFDLQKVEITAKKNGAVAPGIGTLLIYATSGSLPTGAALATKTFDADAVGTSYENVSIVLDSALTLTGSTEYALVVHVANNGAWPFYLAYGNPGDYAGGQGFYSSNSGSSWSASATIDADFRLYSGAETIEIVGTAGGTSGSSGTLTVNTVISISGSAGGTSSTGGALGVSLNITPNWQTTSFSAANKRLVVIGNDALYYEDI